METNQKDEQLNKFDNAKKTLREAGYFTDNLWHIRDVMDRYKCDENTAQEILYDALTNEYIIEKIFAQIDDYATTRNLLFIP